jgi:Photoprotection regulator fluorescence recovery protein
MTQPKFENHYTDMRNLNWSAEEKAIARKAFDRALQQELQEVIEKTKKLSAKITGPDDLWKLESYLKHRREEIDRDYDYRYSVLPIVFGRLIREGRLNEQDLQGLGEDKLFYIRQITRL